MVERILHVSQFDLITCHGWEFFGNCMVGTNLDVPHLDWHFMSRLGQFLVLRLEHIWHGCDKFLRQQPIIARHMTSWRATVKHVAWTRVMAWLERKVSRLGYFLSVTAETFKGLDNNARLGHMAGMHGLYTHAWTHDSNAKSQTNLLRHVTTMHEEKASRLGHLRAAYDLDTWHEDRIFE